MKITANKDPLQYADGLSRLVKVPTVSNEKPEIFAEYRSVLKQLFPLIFKNAEFKQTLGDAIVLKWKGKGDKKPIVLMAHQDVVPAGSGKWKYPPFSGTVADGKIWGRGTGDCKGTMYAEMSAVEELMEEGYIPENDVYMAFSDGEEVFGPGAAANRDYIKSLGVKPFAVLDEGGAIIGQAFAGVTKPYSVIGVYEKGYADVKFFVKSKGGHSSMPGKGTPITRLSAFINYVEKHDLFKKHMDEVTREMLSSFGNGMKGGVGFILRNLWLFKPLIVWLLPKINSYGNALLSTTIAFTMSGGSSAPNVLPEEAYVIANLRYSTVQGGDECLAILKKIAARYGVETEVLNTRDASRIASTSGEAYKYTAKCAKECFPDYGIAPYVILGGTDCRVFQDISDGALRFCPLYFDKQQLDAMHAADENVGIESLKQAVGFYKHFIKNNI